MGHLMSRFWSVSDPGIVYIFYNLTACCLLLNDNGRIKVIRKVCPLLFLSNIGAVLAFEARSVDTLFSPSTVP